MFESVLVPFFTIALAELLDKSQLSVLLLASKTKQHMQLLLGVLLAFLIVDGAAVFFGAWLTSIVPLFWVKMLSGVLFFIFGVKALLEKVDNDASVGKIRNTFLTGFSLIFVSEWGDKTQLASALFSTKFDPFAVLLGVMLALFLLSVSAIYLGKLLTARLDRRLITRIAGVLFIVLGISFFFLP